MIDYWVVSFITIGIVIMAIAVNSAWKRSILFYYLAILLWTANLGITAYRFSGLQWKFSAVLIVLLLYLFLLHLITCKAILKEEFFELVNLEKLREEMRTRDLPNIVGSAINATPRILFVGVLIAFTAKVLGY